MIKAQQAARADGMRKSRRNDKQKISGTSDIYLLAGGTRENKSGMG